jgi:beta-fructofuranosidase
VFDPDAWYDARSDSYYQISGGMQPALFKSKDMHEWKYLGDLLDRSNTMRYPEEDLSCPDFFSLGGDKSMLLFISHQLGAQYYIGTFAHDKFSPEQHGRMNWPGGTFFAPEQLRDGKGRNIIWGWVVERKPPYLRDYGWSGIMSLPRVVALGDDGNLRINPPEEIKTLRMEETRDEDIELAPDSVRALRAHGKSIELTLQIFGAEKSPVGIKVFASPDGREETLIFYDPLAKELVVDFSRSSVKGSVSYSSSIYPDSAFASPIAGFPKRVSRQRAPLKLKEGEPLELDIFLDRSVVEVFANGIQCITQVVYPELDNSTGAKVFSGKEKISVKKIRSWAMAETNPY